VSHDHASPVHTLSSLDTSLALVLDGFGALVLGVCGGALLATLARRRQLSPAWMLASLTPALLLSALIAILGVSPALLVGLASAFGAAGAAIGLSLRAEIEDRRAGGDRAIRAAEMHSPFDPLRTRLRRRGEQERCAEAIPLGRTRREELASLSRGSGSSGSHVLVPGATGAGKTTSLASLLIDYVVRSGFGAVVLEAKNDAALLAAARGAAEATGKRLHLVSPAGPAGYDPLAHGSVDERSERLIAVEGWGSADADFYRQAASPFLRLVLRVLDVGPGQPTLARIAAACDPDQLGGLALDTDAELGTEVASMLRALRADQKRAIAGLQARLANLAGSDFASGWLDPERSGPEHFDLRGAIEAGELVYFRFDTDRTGNVGRAIAQMVLLDLGAAASAGMGRGRGTFVCVDEFGALEAAALDRLYTRGRAAGFSVALGTQTLADLQAAGPAVRERIGATVSGLVCHRIGEQADAEWVAELIGAVPAWQSTIRTDGLGHPTAEGTRSRGYRFQVNPSELQRLGPGEAFVARLDRDGPERARRVRVVPPWERLPALTDTPTTKRRR
jgi:hypothetical protein